MKIDKEVFAVGRTWVLAGIAILLSSQLIKGGVDFKTISADLLLQLGLAFIGLGIVAIIIQFKDWKEYFQERLKEIVLKRSYLDTLNDKELSELQIDTLKAKYKGSDIDREGSFLHFFQKKIQYYISTPYRENVNSSISIKEIKDDDKHFIVYDTTSYVCRSIGDKIQSEVKWTYEPDEFYEVLDVELTLKCNGKYIDKCKENCNGNSHCVNGIISLNKDTLKDKFFVDEEHVKGYLVPLESILHPVDSLQVELVTCYKIKKWKMFTWAMTNPSKGINFTINFPEGYEFNTFVGGVEPREYSKNFNGNMYSFNHDGWFLPMTGLAWSLAKKEHAELQVVPEVGQVTESA